MLFALGLGPDLIAVTHECDYPAAARALPRITRDVLPAGLSSGEIDAAVKERTLAGESIYELDGDALRDLGPDLIVTQALCSVCAVSLDDVRAIAEEIETRPEVISLDPHTVGEVLGDARTLAQATGRKDAAVQLIQDAAARIDRVRLAVRGAKPVSVAAPSRPCTRIASRTCARYPSDIACEPTSQRRAVGSPSRYRAKAATTLCTAFCGRIWPTARMSVRSSDSSRRTSGSGSTSNADQSTMIGTTAVLAKPSRTSSLRL